jgi:hypothetical protein
VRPLAALLALALAACAGPAAIESGTDREATALAVFDPAMVLQDEWIHLPLRGLTDYRLTFLDGQMAFRAEPSGSASVLIRRVAIDPVRCPILEWSWRVERLQPGADLRTREGDDVAAAIFLLFGDPGMVSDPVPVPTLRYVWTNDRIVKGAVIESPYLPGVVHSLVVESGAGRLGGWVTERRDMAADFYRAFGRKPADGIGAIAIFTDNDQTGEAALAHYGAARVLCRD